MRVALLLNTHRVAKFSGVHSLDLLLSGSVGGLDAIEVAFIGLKGEFAEVSTAEGGGGVRLGERGTGGVAGVDGRGEARQAALTRRRCAIGLVLHPSRWKGFCYGTNAG